MNLNTEIKSKFHLRNRNIYSNKIFRSSVFIVVIFLGTFLLNINQTEAATKTWTGGGANGNWSTGANWGGTAPAANDTLVFPDGPTNKTTNNDVSGRSYTIQITGSNYTLAGNLVTLRANLPAGSGTGNLISLPLALGGNRTITVTSPGSLTISGVISGANSVTKAGTGELILSGLNTYTLATNISAGTLRLGAAGNTTNTPAGTSAGGVSVTAGAVLDLNGYTLATAESLTIRGTGISNSGALMNSSSTNVIYSGLITLGAASTIEANAGNILISNTGTITGATRRLTLGGTSQGSDIDSIIGNTTGGVTKIDVGTWILSGANTYTGATTINGGTLLVNGSTSVSSAVAVNNSGTLGGNGTISGAITLASGGTLYPGTSSTTMETLSTAGVTMNTSSTYSIDLNGTGTTSDKISSTGTVTCAGTLTVENLYNPALGRVYTIINASVVTGTFSGLPDGATFTQQGRLFQINYTGTTVTLTDTVSGTLSVDIVDAGGTSVATSSFDFNLIPFSFSFQTATGTFGTSSQKIRVDNTTSNPQWSLSLAATAGPTALWQGATYYYDFNDPTTNAVDGADADIYGGQMTINPSTGTITPKSGCVNTGLTLGSAGAFSQAVMDSVTLVTAGATAQNSCYWDVTGIGVSQTVPAEQSTDSYSLSMTLSIIAI